MKKRTIIAMAIAATTLGFATVHAHPRSGMGPGPMMMGPGGEGGPGMMLPVLLHSAHLTDDQEAQVRKIMEGRRTQMRSLMGEMKAAQDGLLDRLFTAGDLKAADLKPQLDRLTQARQQLMEHAVAAALDVRKVLTPDQLSHAAQVKDRMRALHTQMRQLMEGGEE